MEPLAPRLARVALTVLLTLVLADLDLAAQTGTVRGRVTAEGAPLAEALVVAVRPDGAAARRVVTGGDGQYELIVPVGTYDIVATALARSEGRADDVTVAAGAILSRDFVLAAAPFPLDPVSVTAGRHPQKALDAPASLSVVDVTDIESRVALSAMDYTDGVVGVDIGVQGIQARQVVTRGFNAVFGSLLTTLTDYRHASIPSLRANLSHFIAPVGDDIERVEILRGPASALYGPSAADGVVHFITKSPFESQGTSVDLVGGGQSLFHGLFRHATALNDRVAFKLSGQYFRGEEWPVQPQGTEMAERDPIQERAAGEFRMDARLGGGTEAVLTFGATQAIRNIEQSEIGATQVDDWRVGFGQLRVTNGRFFAQAYMNTNNAGDSRTLQTLLPLVDNSRLLVTQLQHGIDVGDRASFTYGLDLQRTDSRTAGTLNGRNESDDAINEIGGYLQGEVTLTDQLKAVGALRLDGHNRLVDPVLSPLAAMVFTPREGHSIRTTYNRAYSTPVPTDLFLDLLAGSLDPLPFEIRARGVPLDGYTFSQACGGPCMASPFGQGGGMPLDATAFWPAVVSIMQAGGVDLTGIPAPTAADVGTTLRSLDLATASFAAYEGSFETIDPLLPTITNTFELGYKGLFSDRLLLGADLYFTRRQDFRSSLLVETPNAFLDTDDLAAYLARFMPAAQAGPLAAGIGGVDGDPAATGIPLGTVVPDDPLAGSDILLTYRNFGELDIWGVDLSMELLLSEWLSGSVAYSHLSENFFSAADLGQDFTLNAPRHKAYASLNYRNRDSGTWAALRGRFIGAFRQIQGVWTGDVEAFNTIDFEVGAPVPGATGLSLGLSARNVTNDRHSEFVGSPVIGRLLLVSAKYRH